MKSKETVPGDPDLLKEYDFSGRVRGKYAARYHEGAKIGPSFHEGDMVTLRGDEAQTGLVQKTRFQDTGYQYLVFFSSEESRWIAEDELEPCEPASRRRGR